MALGRSKVQPRFDDPRGLLGERLRGIYLLLADNGGAMFGDDYFADLYTSSRLGRPTIPARVLATVMLLQSHEGLSDQEACDRLECDATSTTYGASCAAHFLRCSATRCRRVRSSRAGGAPCLGREAVSLLWRSRCGECRACLSGHSERCALGRVEATTGGLLDGTTRLSSEGAPVHHLLGVSCFAERCVIPERSVVRLPEGVPCPVAAIAGCAVVTGVGAVRNALDSPAGRSLVVVGAGGVGCAAVMGAVVAGAFPIIAIDPNPGALDLARSLGATRTVLAEGDVDAAIREHCPDGADCAIEAVGRPETLRLAFGALRPGGTLAAVGLGTVGEQFSLPTNELVQQEKRVVGSPYGSASPPLELARIFSLYRSGQLALDRLFGATFGLADVNAAVAQLVAGGAGRSVILPGV